MSSERSTVNPFYFLLILVGIAFFITACAYGVVTFRALRSLDVDAGGSRLLDWMDQHGMTLIWVELGLLAVGVFGAIWLDSVRESRAAQRAARPTSPSENVPPRE
jgi:hypothetical protein